MNILITRHHQTNLTIDGRLSIGGIHICDCAENAHTALSPGTYPIAIIHCRQHARKMPVVLSPAPWNALAPSERPIGAPGTRASALALPPCSSCHRRPHIGINTPMPRKCVQLCPGNGVYNRTDGAIILGEYLVPGCLKHPKTTFDNLYDRLRKAAERGHPITLTIEG